MVRKQAYTVLATKSKMEDLTIEERACLLKRGLKDRSSGVASAAVALVQTWLLQDCEASILELLSKLDVRRYPGKTQLQHDLCFYSYDCMQLFHMIIHAYRGSGNS